MSLQIICAILSIGTINSVHGLNILAVFTYNGPSHFDVFRPYLQELSRRNHSITVISHFPQNPPIKNYQDINFNDESHIAEGIPVEKSIWTILEMSIFLSETGVKDCRMLLENKQVQALWKTKQKFDVVVTEMFQCYCSLGLAYKLDAPVVGITSHGLLSWHYEYLGIPFNPSYVPPLFLESGSKPTLYQRLQSSFVHMFYTYYFKNYNQRINHQILKEYFDVPPLDDLVYDIKIVLLYQSFVFTGSRLYPSNVKEMNGLHINKPQPLNAELRKFIEESEHGVIYISFGTVLKATTIPPEKLTSIIETISKLPQRFIWKWDNDALPGNPKNVYLAKWLPQNDLLAHDKVVAFFSHCGLLGLTEAMYHGVPVIGMPVFGDQPSNAAALKESGLGVHIELSDLNQETLMEKFKTVLDPKFRENVKLLSKAWHDQPVKPMDAAIFWTEYAAKHNIVNYRNPAVDVPFYQYYCLDIFFIFASIVLAIILPPIYLISKVLHVSKIKKD